MARTGRFGRLPREATDLTSTIVALIERYEGQRDENIFDAWANGGKFEGKKVTDKDILQHIKDRRDSIPKDDPMWDEWNNRLWQYGFQIAEEKVGQNYEEGDIKAGGVADFYRNWAQKVPKNSSVYRELMTNAARFAKIAQASQAKAEKKFNYEKFLQNYKGIEKEYVKPLESAWQALGMLAVRHGWLSEEEAKNPEKSLLSLTTSETSAFEALLADAETDPFGKGILREIGKAIPGWDGKLDVHTLRDLSVLARRGDNMLLKLVRRQEGDWSSWESNILKSKALHRTIGKYSPRMDIITEYEELYDEYQADFDGATLVQRLQLNKQFHDDLAPLLRKSQKWGFEEIEGGLVNEMAALRGDVDHLKGGNAYALIETHDQPEGGPMSPGSPNMLEQRARDNFAMAQEYRMLARNEGAMLTVTPEISPYGGVSPSWEQAGMQRNYKVMPFNKDPAGNIVQDETFMKLGEVHPAMEILNPDGTLESMGQQLIPVYVEYTPIFSYPESKTAPGTLDLTEDPHVIARQGVYKGTTMTEILDDDGNWKAVATAIGDQPGVHLEPMPGVENGLLIVEETEADTPWTETHENLTTRTLSAIGEQIKNRRAEIFGLGEGAVGADRPLEEQVAEVSSSLGDTGTKEASEWLRKYRSTIENVLVNQGIMSMGGSMGESGVDQAVQVWESLDPSRRPSVLEDVTTVMGEDVPESVKTFLSTYNVPVGEDGRPDPASVLTPAFQYPDQVSIPTTGDTLAENPSAAVTTVPTATGTAQTPRQPGVAPQEPSAIDLDRGLLEAQPGDQMGSQVLTGAGAPMFVRRFNVTAFMRDIAPHVDAAKATMRLWSTGPAAWNSTVLAYLMATPESQKQMRDLAMPELLDGLRVTMGADRLDSAYSELNEMQSLLVQGYEDTEVLRAAEEPWRAGSAQSIGISEAYEKNRERWQEPWAKKYATPEEQDAIIRSSEFGAVAFPTWTGAQFDPNAPTIEEADPAPIQGTYGYQRNTSADRPLQGPPKPVVEGFKPAPNLKIPTATVFNPQPLSIPTANYSPFRAPRLPEHVEAADVNAPIVTPIAMGPHRPPPNVVGASGGSMVGAGRRPAGTR